MRRVFYLMQKEFLELRQEPRLFGIVIIAPLIQLTMLGYAATTDVRNVPVVVVDQDRSSASRDLITRFDVSDNFTIIDTVSSVDEIDAYLDSGRAWMALVIPARYGEQIRTGRSAVVQVVADGTDANSTNVALGYTGALIAEYARELVAQTGQGTAIPLVDVELRNDPRIFPPAEILARCSFVPLLDRQRGTLMNRYWQLVQREFVEREQAVGRVGGAATHQ